MKILWASNAPWGQSGYANQSALFGTRIVKHGHELAYYSNIGNEHATMLWNGFKVYPGDMAWGNKTMLAAAAHFADGLEDCQIICLGDAWVLEAQNWHKDTRMAIWAPVDHSPLPSIVRNVLAHPNTTPIAMSRFGEEQMRLAGLDPLYVPHGVDTELFRPLPGEKQQIQRELNLPEGAFVIGMVAANMGAPLFSRKAFPQVFQAFTVFRESHPDAVMYVHTNQMPANRENGGLHLPLLARACGIPQRALRFTEQFAWDLGVKREEVARMMAAFDVLVNPSCGEGFGIPILEAQACGVPVITTNWTSMPELTAAGWMVEGDLWYDAPQDSWFKVPSVAEIVQALEHAYEARDDQALSDKARAFALDYDVNTVMDTYWKPVLEHLDRPKVVPPLNRAMRRAKAKTKVAA